MRRKTTPEQRARIAEWATQWEAGTAAISANQVAAELDLSPQLVYYHARRALQARAPAVSA